MYPWKAPGPDGLHAGFYQTYWGTVGKEVTELALSILNGKWKARKNQPDKYHSYSESEKTCKS